ncbi:hypothetical protein [Thiomicrorhabdus sp. 6S3-12]|uniref:hypothetical protein n=1 Tax=Thiomicrorhabdus sp. 6S3-12 TaxID=2819681 RepID=UPI001AADB3D1|nr:hypothetical protein [Thiomicrorhabdus sp. 6S3-12]MBO1923952.1 hypothetical protein [Thiomicrorhabdus sp. 6S3-12]
MLNKVKQRIRDDWKLFLQNYWLDRKPIYTPDDPQWHNEGLSFAFISIILIGMTLFFSPMPPDDLLRHVHAWQYGYDYRLMFDGYPYHFNAWYGFDWVAGNLYQAFGAFSIKLIQTASIALLALVVYLNLHEAHKDTRIFLLLFVIWAVGDRFLLARPTIFETLLMFLAIAASYKNLKPQWDALLHLTLGCLMASFYHLFFIYLIPLLFWRRIYLFPLLAGVIGWQWFSGGQYFQEVMDIFNFGSMRIDGINVTENRFALPAILLLGAFALLFVYHWQRTDKQWLLTAGWFSLPMQIRYVMDNLFPILIFILGRHWKIRPHPFLILFMLVMVKGTLGSSAFYFSQKPQTTEYFAQGEHILAQNLGVNFWVINQGANQQVRVAPAMEIGFADNAIQQATLEKKVSCELLRKFDFDKYVENSAVELPTECLQLQASTADGYKIWKVLHNDFVR